MGRDKNVDPYTTPSDCVPNRREGYSYTHLKMIPDYLVQRSESC